MFFIQIFFVEIHLCLDLFAKHMPRRLWEGFLVPGGKISPFAAEKNWHLISDLWTTVASDRADIQRKQLRSQGNVVTLPAVFRQFM